MTEKKLQPIFFAVLAAVFALAVGMLGGCGNNAQPAADSTKAEENTL